MPDQNTGSPSHAPTSDQPVDLECALNWVDGDRELLAELVDIFVQDCPARLEELRESIAAGDARRAHRVAHGLKGSVTGFGAESARNLAQQIELMAKDGNLAEAADALSALEKELARVLEGLAGPKWKSAT